MILVGVSKFTAFHLSLCTIINGKMGGTFEHESIGPLVCLSKEVKVEELGVLIPPKLSNWQIEIGVRRNPS